jgi:GcrA cell cycle regulator
MTWTDERTDEVVKLYLAGMGPSEIARRFNLTRNQVLSKMVRMGHARKAASTPGKPPRTSAHNIARKGAAALKSAQERSAAASTPKGAFVLPAYTGDPKTPPHVKKMAAVRANLAAKAAALEPKTKLHPAGSRVYLVSEDRPLPPEIDQPGLRTVTTIGYGECRWPIGDPQEPTFTLCGCKAESGPYCGPHAQRAYVATPPKQSSWTPEMREAAAHRARIRNAARRRVA